MIKRSYILLCLLGANGLLFAKIAKISNETDHEPLNVILITSQKPHPAEFDLPSQAEVRAESTADWTPQSKKDIEYQGNLVELQLLTAEGDTWKRLSSATAGESSFTLEECATAGGTIEVHCARRATPSANFQPNLVCGGLKSLKVPSGSTAASVHGKGKAESETAATASTAAK